MIFIAKIALQLSGLTKATKTLSDARAMESEVLEPVVSEYRAFVLKRFDKFSRGGGNWPPNSPQTQKRKGSTAILVDTRAMRLGLAADGIGMTDLKTLSGRVRMTFSFTSPEAHPKSKKLTISDLASIHHAGQGRVPARPILARPTPDVRLRMATRGIESIARSFL